MYTAIVNANLFSLTYIICQELGHYSSEGTGIRILIVLVFVLPQFPFTRKEAFLTGLGPHTDSLAIPPKFLCRTN